MPPVKLVAIYLKSIYIYIIYIHIYYIYVYIYILYIYINEWPHYLSDVQKFGVTVRWEMRSFWKKKLSIKPVYRKVWQHYFQIFKLNNYIYVDIYIYIYILLHQLRNLFFPFLFRPNNFFKKLLDHFYLFNPRHP